MTTTPALQNFLAAYFHQDWAMEHGSAGEVVAYYLGSESDAGIVAVRDDLAHVAAEDLDEQALGERFKALGCEYDPGRDGSSWRDWFAALQVAFTR